MEGHRSFATLNMPGCIHPPPCPVSDTADKGELGALRKRWLPEFDEVYMNAPAIGWFKADT